MHNDDATLGCSIGLGPLAILLLCVVASPAGAATTVWRTELARGGVGGFAEISSFGEVHPSADGFWLVGSSYDAGWVARHALDGSLIGLQRYDGRIGSARSDTRGGLVMRRAPRVPGDDVTVDECAVERGAVGAPRTVTSLDPGSTDAGDGVSEAGEIFGFDGRSPDLFRAQRDCRILAMPAIGRDEILDVRNDPGAVAAYVLARDADDAAPEIVRVDRDRVLWRQSLGALVPRTAYVELGDADAGGVGLGWTDPEAPGFRHHFARVTVDGRLAWQRELDRTNSGLVAWSPAPLIVRYASQFAVGIEALDRNTGETRFVAAPPIPLRWVERLATARVDGGWRLAGVQGETGPATVLDVAPSGTIRVRWRAGDGTYRARVELADGSLVLSRSRDLYLKDWALVAPGDAGGTGRDLPDAGRAPVAETPQLLVPGPEGAVLVAYHEELRAYVARVERDGRVAWAANLPSPSAQFRGVRVVAAATGATRACVLVQITLANQMRCFDARNGAPAFEVGIDGQGTNWRLGIFADGIHLVDSRAQSNPRVEVQRLRVFGPVGELRLQRDLPLENSFDTLSPFGASGELLATSSRTVRAIAPDGTLRWSADRPIASTARVAPGGGALLTDFVFEANTVRTELRRIGPDGTERWRRSFGEAGVAALGTDWLVRDASTTRRVADVDGNELWSVPRAAPGTLRAAAPDGSGFVEGAAWYDGGTGARVGSLIDPRSLVGNALHRFDSDGGLLRFAAQLDENGSSLMLERLERDVGAGPRARLATTGFWHAPSVPGQGIAVAVDGRGDAEGRWLTFDQSGATRIDAQRWYRLSGRTASDGDSVAFAIEAPQPSGFDGGSMAWRAVGAARWRMRDCSRAELDYRIEDDEVSRRGLLVLERLDVDLDCEARPQAAPRADVDVWTANGDPGRSLLVAQRRDGTVLAYWPTFVPAGADAGRPHWLLLDGDAGALRIERTLAGRFADGATRNTLTIGSATLRRAGCNRLAFDYRFDAGEVAAPFDELSGRLVLQRRGTCPR